MRPTTKNLAWQKRLYLPAYQVRAASAYAGVTSQTVRNWQKSFPDGIVLAPRDHGVSLSYMQLQELAIVSAMRRLRLKLSVIRLSRDYLANLLQVPFPFADQRVTSDGQDVLLQLHHKLPSASASTLLVANKGGQYAWSEIIGERFEQFEYERGMALKWHLTPDQRVIIDPRVSFGSPAVKGVPTWALRGREVAGESIEEMADDFNLTPEDVKAALAFEHSLH